MDLTEFNALVERLRNPAVFDHRVSAVSVIETHISAVLLAGEYAYKIKKPVDFGFVDFSTLDKRRYFCREELRLNRRFAPDLYLSVARIHGSPESPTFREDGPVIEYAVRMRRFDQDTLLDRCLHQPGLVTGAMMESFAEDVAAVHAAADRAAPGMGYGTPGVVAANVRDCRVPIGDAGLLEGQPRYQGLFEYTENEAHILGPWFDRRLRDGRVRECHGDLHLGNLFLSEGRIRAFDCIEFNPDLRWIDVANDIAFFTMDLRFHGEPAFARRFRNTYLEASGDYSALRVLHFYEIYRALVRAEVACLKEEEQAGAGLGDAGAHLDLAVGLMREAPGTPLIITHGLSGSGKTFASGRLLAASDAIRVRSDVERDRRLKKGRERYTDHNVDLIYSRLLELAREIVSAGYPVIVDATFLKRAQRTRFRHLAADLAVPFRILHCRTSTEELRARIVARAQRGADASEADLAVLELQIGTQEPLARDELPYVIEYDTGGRSSLSTLAAGLSLDMDRAPRGPEGEDP